MSNFFKTKDGQEIYTNEIYVIADEYIASLPDPNLISNTNGNCFTGLIKYINVNMNFNRDMYADINLLNDIWEIYTSLVYKYNQKPTIEEYCLLIGCSRSILYSWMNDEVRAGDICEKLGSSRSDTIKKWSEECRIGRYKGAQAGNVGCIFLCKAVDGMVETAPVQVANQYQHQTIEQIQEKHQKALQIGDKEPPQAEF